MLHISVQWVVWPLIAVASLVIQRVYITSNRMLLKYKPQIPTQDRPALDDNYRFGQIVIFALCLAIVALAFWAGHAWGH